MGVEKEEENEKEKTEVETNWECLQRGLLLLLQAWCLCVAAHVQESTHISLTWHTAQSGDLGAQDLGENHAEGFAAPLK